MALHFVTNEGVYHPPTDSVRFFALDGENPITLEIERAALEKLEGRKLSEREAEQAYTKNIERIQKVARHFYAKDGVGSYAPHHITETL